MQAFFLGLSNGTVCMAYCAPILIPYLFSEGRGIGQSFSIVARFLSGRLLGYLVFGFFAWGIGQTLLSDPFRRNLMLGSVNMILAVLLIPYGFFRTGTACTAEKASGRLLRIAWPQAMLPVVIGLFTGLNFCPPFLLAFANATGEPSLFRTMIFFFLFFLGTSIYFIPLPLIGTLQRARMLAIIGKMAVGIVGIYYFFTGLMLIIAVYTGP